MSAFSASRWPWRGSRPVFAVGELPEQIIGPEKPIVDAYAALVRGESR
jgi:hypothetical protein